MTLTDLQKIVAERMVYRNNLKIGHTALTKEKWFLVNAAGFYSHNIKHEEDAKFIAAFGALADEIMEVLVLLQSRYAHCDVDINEAFDKLKAKLAELK